MVVLLGQRIQSLLKQTRGEPIGRVGDNGARRKKMQPRRISKDVVRSRPALDSTLENFAQAVIGADPEDLMHRRISQIGIYYQNGGSSLRKAGGKINRGGRLAL